MLKIFDLTYLELLDNSTHLQGSRRKSNASTFAFTSAKDGLAMSGAIANSIGKYTLAQTSTQAITSQRATNHKNISKSEATAHAVAISLNHNDDFIFSEAISQSRFSSREYRI